MPHIPLPPEHIGIRGAMAFRPETAKPLNEIVEILLLIKLLPASTIVGASTTTNLHLQA